jgi:ABC-2 type transport system permease protein
MRKILKIARREYIAAVRTKGFIIALIVVPIFMGGSGLAFALLKDRVDVDDKRIVLIDHSGAIAEGIMATAAERNEREIRDPETGRQLHPAYLFELCAPDSSDPAAVRLALSERVRHGELHAFVEIGPDVVHPGENAERSRIGYHAQSAALDDIRAWLGGPVNTQVRRLRLHDLGVADSVASDLFRYAAIEPLGLVSVDRASGKIQEARRSNEAEAILAPMILPMLMFMMIMMGAVSQLSAVTEEKAQRIAEVMLGALRPFQFMMGKVLGGVAVSLTGVAVYVLVGLAVVQVLHLETYAPFHVLPWFFAFLVLAIFMLGSIYTALGAACNDAKEAQSVSFPALLPVMIPMFVLMPLLQHPNSPFATWMSLIPIFTPMVMVLRLATPVTIPAWQPWLGLVLVIATAIFAAWAGGRLFRITILMQGAPPKFGNLIRWALRG